MSFATCDRDATQAPGNFQPSGPRFFRRISASLLGQYRKGYRHFARFLKFAQAPRGDWQAIPVTQHERVGPRLFVNVLL